jgi:hypothetical protein
MIAIDPGQSGGIASNEEPGDIVAWAMPKTDREIADRLSPGANPIAYLEDLVKFTGRNMPSSAMAVYASNWGFIKGVLTARGFRIVIIHPKTWQKALGLGTTKSLSRTEWKNKLKQKAEQLYPKIKVTLATADALLILEAARRGALG